ncbi:MAG: pyridoxal-phosphate dependent enzyme, partial [Deltaproteobacteria bacterium]|nr:pyridoxal-phosphate dependent enzyme [Deltaproteobacteria bacterium]
DKTQAEEIVHVEDEEGFETARRLARQEGLFLGMSSGAAVAVAIRKAREMESGLIVAIAPDSGERYLSTPLFPAKEAPPLQFYNTLAQAKEAFDPRRAGEATIFTDGPALNAPLSLGVARRLAVADLLQRYLRFRDFQARQVVSLIDLDDRALAGAAAAGQDLADFTGHFRREFLQDLESLGIQEGNLYPLASEHIEDMVQLSRRLLEKGFAYEKLRSVYFDISRFKDYGRLSRVDLSKIKVGKTVDLDEYAKENPRDFTLFKRAKLGELKKGLYFSTPWGKVRPSWHLECAAMALKHLGESADFHVGGIESLFPHEENENALFTAYTAANLKSAAAARARLDHFLERLTLIASEGSPQAPLEERLFLLKKEFTAALDDDLNISRALSAIFAMVGELNADIDRGRLGHGDAGAILARLEELDEVLGVMTPPHPRRDAAVEALLAQREEARQRRDWAEADRIRQDLAAQGIDILDTPTGPRWRRSE